MMRVLLTSFEPFGSDRRNSSLEVGERVAVRPPPGVELEWLVLPVVAAECVALAAQRIRATRPDLVLALGQAESAAGLRVETQGVNCCDFDIPDNAGRQLRDTRIEPHGPDAYAATVPVDRVVRALTGQGVGAEASDCAGTYVCNYLLYGLLHQAAVEGWPSRIGFVHLPLVAGQRGPTSPGVPAEVLAEGVRGIIAACLPEFIDLPAEGQCS